MNLKLRAKNYIESHGCKLLSDYKNRDENILIECKCGETMTKSFKQFTDSKLKCCTDCAYKLRKHNKLTHQEVERYISKQNCKLLSEYKNANSPLMIKYKCNHDVETTFARFKHYETSTCNQCAKKKGAKIRSHGFKSVKLFIENTGCKLLEVEYKNANTSMLLQCKCGVKWKSNFHTFQRSKYKACKLCSSLKLDSDRIKRKNGTYIKLDLNVTDKIRKDVFSRDNHTCKKCGFSSFDKRNHNLNAHHLFNKVSFPKWKYKSINLITLCAECHVNFHKQFGYSNNTPKQMKIYLKGII